MAWCKDTARDEAVRAAEDNRQGPLPTLEEAIAASFACTACGGFGMDHRCKESCKECSPQTSDGLRTERVTLEITGAPGWKVHVTAIDAESVRVVEESHFDDLAQVAMERDAAIRERESLREQLESVACRAATAETALDARTSTSGEGSCDAPAASGGGEGEPVADAWGPQPASVWLTQDEIAVCVGLRNYCRGTWETWGRKDTLWLNRATTLAALLARSSPPEAAP
jgi:hypothetical protein